MNRPKLKANLFELKQRLALTTGREYSWAAIARASELNVRTVMDLANGNGSTRVDLTTLEKLMGFFRSEGMAITLCDLLIEVDPALDADRASGE